MEPTNAQLGIAVFTLVCWCGILTFLLIGAVSALWKAREADCEISAIHAERIKEFAMFVKVCKQDREDGSHVSDYLQGGNRRA